MKLALDARKLRDFGIGTYIRALLEEFAALGRPEAVVAYIPPGVEPPARARGAPSLAWVTEPAPAYSIAELWRLALQARRARPDVFHAPHYVCPPWLPCPAVVTVHDVIHLRFPAQRRHPLAPLYARVMLRLAVRRAARVITGSEASRRDLERYLGARPDRLRLIPYGVAPRFRPAPEGSVPDPRLAALGVVTPYFLFVGNPLPHKNLPRVLDAFRALPDDAGRLVVAGVPPAARPGVAAACEARGLDARVAVLTPLPGDTLAALYRFATALVCPSLWEGFGLPALEAMASGTPVVASDRGGLAEVVGAAGLRVDPTNVDALRDAMYNLATQESLRAALRTAGMARARAFSWRDTAERTIAVYREAVAQPRPAQG